MINSFVLWDKDNASKQRPVASRVRSGKVSPYRLDSIFWQMSSAALSKLCGDLKGNRRLQALSFACRADSGNLTVILGRRSLLHYYRNRQVGPFPHFENAFDSVGLLSS
jgi:hypothetical protein